MSKYKRGDKFWFEITDVIEAGGGKIMYLCSTGGYAADGILDGYNRLDPDEKADWWSDGYNSGLNDAWEAAKIASHMAVEERGKYIGKHWLGDVFDELTPAQVIEGVREYKKMQYTEAEIKVGDEVELRGGKDGFCRFFVTRITRDRVAGTASDGRWASCDKREARKTGRHFPQIAEVLEAMKTDDHTDTD